MIFFLVRTVPIQVEKLIGMVYFNQCMCTNFVYGFGDAIVSWLKLNMCVEGISAALERFQGEGNAKMNVKKSRAKNTDMAH